MVDAPVLGYERFVAKHELMPGREAGATLDALNLLTMGEEGLWSSSSSSEDDVSDVSDVEEA